jgi:hypothetical protein
MMWNYLKLSFKTIYSLPRESNRVFTLNSPIASFIFTNLKFINSRFLLLRMLSKESHFLLLLRQLKIFRFLQTLSLYKQQDISHLFHNPTHSELDEKANHCFLLILKAAKYEHYEHIY